MAERTQQEVVRRSGHSLSVVALFLMILLAAGLPLPQRAIAILPIVVVGVISVLELRRLQRTEAPAVSRFGPFLTLGFVGMMLLAAATQVALYAPQKAFEDCLAHAKTQAAQADCSKQRQQSVIGNIMEF